MATLSASPSATALHGAIAAHRFGLGEAALDATVRGDGRGWLLAQIGPADVQRGANLPSAVEGVRRYAEFVQERRRRRESEAAPSPTDMRAGEQPLGEQIRQRVQADQRARMVTAATTMRPFAERLALFWANHFTVSLTKASTRGLVGAFEREAIRPHIAGSFEQLLAAAVMHPGLLRYLDNEQSAGPNSAVVQRLARRPRGDNEPGPRITGLNENLAREVLELHTLGAAAAREGTYTQADVTAFARVLTGWRVPVAATMDGVAGGPRNAGAMAAAGDASPTRFEPQWHEPGSKTLLGQRYPEGAQGLSLVLRDLAHHPATARFIATKMARHFVADAPPPALVDRLAQRFLASDGDLPTLYRTLIESNEAWSSTAAKLKTPEELVLSSARLLRLGDSAFARNPDGGIATMGQRLQSAPSPAGWPDQADEWLGPDAVWKRVEWVTRVADRVGSQIDARALAQASLGALLSVDTLRQIERAADAPQALALLLLAPEFQRR